MEELESQLHKSMRANYFSPLVVFCLVLGYLLPQAVGEIVDLSRVASVLEYPANKLAIGDLTQEWQNQYGEDLLSAYKIDSSDRTFAPMTVAVSTKGVILSKQLEEEIIASLRSAQVYPDANEIMRKLDFDEGAYGYTFLAGGPGGSERIIFATLPRQSKDLLIKITIPGEEPLNVVPETEAYHRLITEGGERLTERLIECAEATIAKVTPMSPPSVQQTPVRPIPPSTSSVVSGDNSTRSQESSDPRPSPAVEAEPSKSFPWHWIIGAILLLAVLGGSLLKLRRK